jgi:hypothetical protein
MAPVAGFESTWMHVASRFSVAAISGPGAVGSMDPLVLVAGAGAGAGAGAAATSSFACGEATRGGRCCPCLYVHVQVQCRGRGRGVGCRRQAAEQSESLRGASARFETQYLYRLLDARAFTSVCSWCTRRPVCAIAGTTPHGNLPRKHGRVRGVPRAHPMLHDRHQSATGSVAVGQRARGAAVGCRRDLERERGGRVRA